jgi:hypothetical protein
MIHMPILEWDTVSEGLKQRYWECKFTPPNLVRCFPKYTEDALADLTNAILAGGTYTQLACTLTAAQWTSHLCVGSHHWVGAPHCIVVLHGLGLPLFNLQQLNAQRASLPHPYVRFAYSATIGVTEVRFAPSPFNFSE